MTNPKPALVAIDIGGSSVKLGVSSADEDGQARIEKLAVLPHDRPAPAELAAAVATLVRSWCAGRGLEPSGFALSLPGPVENGRLLRSDRLGWRELDPGPVFSEALGAPALRVCSDVDTLEAWLHLPADATAVSTARSTAVSTTAPGSSLELLLGSGVGGLLVEGGSVQRRRGLGHTGIERGPVCPSCAGPCLDSTLSAEGLLRATQAAGLEPADARELDAILERDPSSRESAIVAAVFDIAVLGLESARATLGVARVRLAGGVAGSRALGDALARHPSPIEVHAEPRDVPWRGLLMAIKP